MDKDTEQYYDNLASIFLMQGWKDLTEELSANALYINSVEHTKDRDDLNFRKGQLNILSYILNLESTIDRLREDSSNVSNL
jgi:hypothetical protein